MPSAVLLARRSALGDQAFDEQLRLGEDVDLIWRLAQMGGLIRHELASVALTRCGRTRRPSARQGLRYGTSAADLSAAIRARWPGSAVELESRWGSCTGLATRSRRAPASLTVAGGCRGTSPGSVGVIGDQTLASIAGKRPPTPLRPAICCGANGGRSVGS